MSKRPSLAAGLKAIQQEAEPPIMPRPIRAANEGKPASAREGMKRILTPIPPEMHKRLKVLAAQTDQTLEEISRAALAAYLERQG